MHKLSFLIGLILLINFTFGQSPHGKKLKIECDICHSGDGWKVNQKTMSFNHNTTDFMLSGQHKLNDCRSCHKTLEFSKGKTECRDCHIDMHNGTVGWDCARCHNSESWIVENITGMHQQTRFPLVGVHAVADCYACHKSGSPLRFEPLGVDCYDCHKDNYMATTSPNHQSLGYPTNCVECHSMISADWTISNFNHNNFPLSGGHAIICTQCHISGKFRKLSTDCNSCHSTDYDKTENPPHAISLIARTCESCHTTTIWTPSTFNHNSTSYSLTGAHLTTTCASCHTKGYKGTSSLCNSCHATNYSTSQIPNHSNAGIPIDCETCHNTTDWKPSGFNHITTGYDLKGAHKQIAQCSDCHKGVINTAKPECISCHQVQYNNAPVHIGQNFSVDCTQCHNLNNWQGAIFNHDLTNFPLTGTHLTTTCASCHITGYKGTPTLCNSCHAADYTKTINPNHSVSKYPTTCETCHKTTGWTPSTFNHNSTTFPLTGLHVNAPCASCHTNGYTGGTPTLCNSCHAADYTKTANPPHAVSKFPTTCETCHKTTGWTPSTFNHNSTTFPLTGLHVTAPCASCHTNGYTGGTPTLCNSCHAADYSKTINPNHAVSKFPTTCETCHTTTGWTPSTFNHNSTAYPLTGLHVTAPCASCHTNGYTGGTPTLCNSCHAADYSKTINPNHAASQFPTTCESCHKTTGWTPSTFNHNSTTFPLTGLHVTTPCGSCHTNGYTGGTPTLCNSCHAADYNKTINPNHAVSKFPTTCETCHKTTGWTPSTFNHNSTTFPLTGLHVTAPCASCHTNGYTGGTPTLCNSCHAADYTKTANPPHAVSKFPTTCETCHKTTGWTPSTFNHNSTTFPLTGLHVTAPCASCHTNGYTGGTPTLCNSCHAADYNKTINPNHAVSKFPTTCETCHTTTGWTPSTFNHNSTTFPLTGLHVTAPCASCHTNGYTGGTPTLCNSCHAADYNKTINPNHAVSKFPTTCETCHTTTGWTPSTFNHNSTAYPLTGLHVTAPCGSCHTNGYTGGTPTLCNSCHAADYSKTINPNHAASKFPTTCESCHKTTGWTPSTFNHNSTTFPLTGLHVTTPCGSCHTNGYTGGTPTLCNSCHAADYSKTINPNHAVSKFPTTCESCHKTTGWTPSTFNHNSTAYPLTGLHVTTPCGSCHTNGYTGGTPTLCNSCHAADYSKTINPNHAVSKFPATCEICHTTNGWIPSTFNHNSTPFPLTGAHVATACATAYHRICEYADTMCKLSSDKL